MQRPAEDPALHAREGLGKAAERVHWSWPHRVIVFALALLLCFGIFTLVVIARYRSLYAPLCIPATPPLARVSASELHALRAELSSVMARSGGRVYAAGAVPPEVVWNDEPPGGSSLGLAKDGLGPASYEMRLWAPDPRYGSAYRDDLGGEVFSFATAAQATRFFAAGASVRCHRHALARPALRPPGARNIIWFNPDAATEEDVFVLRGRTVYRIVDVRPGGEEKPRWNAQQRVGVATVDRLACTISAAACPPLGARARFIEEASLAVCAFNGELVSHWHKQGPFALFPMRAPVEAIVARAIQRLLAITPPAAQAAAYGRLLGALEGLLALGRGRDAAAAAGDAGLAWQYYERAPAYRSAFARLGTALGIYECAPVETSGASH
jgi:hypothetical protein